MGHLADSQGKIGEHYNLATSSTHPNLASENGPYHEYILGIHDRHLIQQTKTIWDHGDLIGKNAANILDHDKKLQNLKKALEKMKGDRRGRVSKRVLWTLTGATVATAGTDLYFQRSSSKTMADMADRIQTQQGEINRIKALNGQ